MAAFATPVVASVALSDAPAFANGRYPAANALVFSASGSDLVLLRTTFGVLLSRDAGTWDWLCEGALGIPASSIEDPSFALTAGGAIVAGLVEGLEVSTDRGCNWRVADDARLRRSIRDVAIRPDAPHTVVALASSVGAGAGADGGAGYLSQVFDSVDDGAHWAVLGTPLDPTAVMATIEVAAADPQRLYVSAFRGDGPTRTASLFVSTDRGAHWIERPVPLDPSAEGAAYIAAVDPADADRIYVRTDGRSRLLVTADAGVTYVTALTFSGPMLGFAITPDGSRLYAGGPEDGVFVAHQGAPSFTRASTTPVQCLAARGTELWACVDLSTGSFAARSTDDGAHFAPAAAPDAVSAPVACASDATAAQCSGAAFDQLCRTLRGCAPGDPPDPQQIAPYDAGAPEAGAEPREVIPLPRWSCGCSAAGGGGTVVGLLAALVAAGAAMLRKRSPR